MILNYGVKKKGCKWMTWGIYVNVISSGYWTS